MTQSGIEPATFRLVAVPQPTAPPRVPNILQMEAEYSAERVANFTGLHSGISHKTLIFREKK